MRKNQDNDGLQDMFDIAFRQKQEVDANKAMEDARTVMVMSGTPTHVFFSTLVMKLVYRHSWDVKACATDGKKMEYNPEFMMMKTRDMIRAIHAKSVMHCALGHPQMLVTHKHLNKTKLQLAMELVTNQIIKDSGFTMTPEALLPGKGDFKKIKPGLSTVETYREIPDDAADGADGDNASGMGGVSPAQGAYGPASEADVAKMDQDWKINSAMAQNAARLRGTMSANLQTLIDELLKSKVPWREVLREWATRRVKTDYTWQRLNRRHIAAGMYLPTFNGESLTGLIVANDTSGSMDWRNARSACAAEIQAIAEQLNCKITILHHDAAVCSVQTWEPADGLLKLEPRGGGGTSHIPVFDWICEHQAELEEVAGLICLTDLYTAFPADAPDYPVLWAVVGNNGSQAPFGTTIEVDQDG